MQFWNVKTKYFLALNLWKGPSGCSKREIANPDVFYLMGNRVMKWPIFGEGAISLTRNKSALPFNLWQKKSLDAIDVVF